MSPMSDQSVTLATLAKFHREVILPDIERVVERLTKPRFDQIDGHFDAIFHKLDKLETEYEALKAGLGRVEEDQKRMGQTLKVLESQYRDLVAGFHRLEERLALLEERLARVEKSVDELVAGRDKEPLRAEVADLRARVDSLQAQVRTLEKRLDG